MTFFGLTVMEWITVAGVAIGTIATYFKFDHKQKSLSEEVEGLKVLLENEVRILENRVTPLEQELKIYMKEFAATGATIISIQNSLQVISNSIINLNNRIDNYLLSIKERSQ